MKLKRKYSYERFVVIAHLNRTEKFLSKDFNRHHGKAYTLNLDKANKFYSVKEAKNAIWQMGIETVAEVKKVQVQMEIVR